MHIPRYLKILYAFEDTVIELGPTTSEQLCPVVGIAPKTEYSRPERTTKGGKSLVIDTIRRECAE